MMEQVIIVLAIGLVLQSSLITLKALDIIDNTINKLSRKIK